MQSEIKQKEPEQEFKYITPLAGAINIIKRINGIELKEKRKEGAEMGNKKVREMTEEEYTERYKEIAQDTQIKSKFLTEFKIQELKLERAFEEGPEQSKKFIEIAEDIVEILKVEELTYEQAYATLQQAYNQLKYESNFLKV